MNSLYTYRKRLKLLENKPFILLFKPCMIFWKRNKNWGCFWLTLFFSYRNKWGRGEEMKNCKKHKMDYMKMNSRELSERKAYKKLRTKNDEVRKTKINRSLKQNLTQSSTSWNFASSRQRCETKWWNFWNRGGGAREGMKRKIDVEYFRLVQHLSKFLKS